MGKKKKGSAAVQVFEEENDNSDTDNVEKEESEVKDEEIKVEETVKRESAGQVKQRHKREVKELEKKTQEIMKKVSKTDKKARTQAEATVKKLEQELAQRHAKELEEASKSNEENSDEDSKPEPEKSEEKEITEQTEGLSLYGKAPVAKKQSKQQKKKAARVQQELDREKRIKEEKKNIVSYRDLENIALAKKLLPYQLRVKEINPDGNCLYSAIADQLELKGQKTGKDYYKILRKLCADYMEKHADDFMPFVDTEDGIMDSEKFKEYCNTVANTSAWGGQLELRAIANALKYPITVYTADEKSPDVKMGEEFNNISKPLCLSYHQHAYSLGAHYNSVVPVVVSNEDEENSDDDDIEDDDE